MRQALLREQHARTRCLTVADLDARAIARDVESDAGFGKRRTDIRDILTVETGIEDVESGLAEIKAPKAHDAENRDADESERRESAPAKIGETRHELL